MTRRARRRVGGVALVLALVAVAVTPPDRGPFLDAPHRGWQDARLPEDSLVHELFLIGDTGQPQHDPLEPVLVLLQRMRREARAPSTTVFLGDNVYPRGIPPPDDAGAEEAHRRLALQLGAMRGLPGRVVFVPGNHDWGHGADDGAAYVARERALVRAALDSTAYPIPAGRPGPVARVLTDSLVLVALDTAWFLYEQAPDTPERQAQERAFAEALRDTLAAYAGRRLVVVGHHPLFSNGQHSGRYPLRSHVFPLIELRDWAFVPLPGLGSLAFWYVARNGLSPQDLAHPRYRRLREVLLGAFEAHPRLIYAAGHEHNLQYFDAGNGGARLHALVSGAGASAKAEEVVPGSGMAFGYAHVGVMHLRVYASGEVVLDVVVPEKDGNDARLVFRASLG